MENALGFSLGFTFCSESAVEFRGLAAELVQKALANFRGSDRRFPTAVRNRRSDLGDLILSVSNCGHETTK